MSTVISNPNEDDGEYKFTDPKFNLACSCGYVGPADDLGAGPFCPKCDRYVFELPVPSWALKALEDILKNKEL